MSIWEIDKLLLFIGFVIPGFVSLKVYELLIPGPAADKSFSSSSPSEEQIYLEETWLLNEKGEFERPKNQSSGVLIMSGEIAYIELMDYLGERNDEQ